MSGEVQEKSMNDIIKDISKSEKLITQNSMVEMNQADYEEEVLGGRIARFGAWIISVEGEEWEYGYGKKVRNMARIGRFDHSEEFNQYTKICFYTNDGLFYPNSMKLLPRERRTQHPLSKKGFYVPRDGGFIELEDGYILLVSKSGIFCEGTVYEKARQLHSDWAREVNNNHNMHERIQGLTNQLSHTEAQLMLVTTQREDFQTWASELDQRYKRTHTMLVKIRNIELALNAELEGMTWVNTHQQQVIKKHLSDLDAEVRELTVLVFEDKANEQFRQASSQIPSLSPYAKNRVMNNLKRGGMIKDDEQEKQINELRKQNEAMAKIISEFKAKQKEKDEEEHESDDEETGIYQRAIDDDEEGKEPEHEEPSEEKPKEEKPKDDKESKKFFGKVKENIHKNVQDIRENMSKAVSRVPKEEKPKEEPKPEPEQTDEEASEESEEGDDEEE